MYKKAVASFWSVEEVDLSQDTRDWISLSGVLVLTLGRCWVMHRELFALYLKGSVFVTCKCFLQLFLLE